MTDHELAVKMVRQGYDVFKEMNKDILADPNYLTVALLPVMLAVSCQAVYNVYIMKQVAAVISGKEVKLP